MKIRSDSWHYKYVASKWDTRPRALCWYFWKVILSILLWTALGIAVSAAAIAGIVFLAFPIWQWFFSYTDTHQVGALLLWLFIGVLGSYWYRQWLYESGQLIKKRRVHKEPGLMRQYLHARHRKICPLLEYEGLTGDE